MRSLVLVSFSAALLSGCLTSQENPNYEHSTVYRGDPVETTQYATTTPVDASTLGTTTVSYETVPAQAVFIDPVPAATVTMASSPTDIAYGSGEITGTPGFMAMQHEQQVQTYEVAAPIAPDTQLVTAAPMGAAGTPVSYDYSRNLIAADAVTTGQAYPSTSSVLQNIGQNYTVQPGDTVYSLSRKTCVGVSVIQSMNGLGADYGIKIGQSLTLPASVC